MKYEIKYYNAHEEKESFFTDNFEEALRKVEELEGSLYESGVKNYL